MSNLRMSGKLTQFEPMTQGGTSPNASDMGATAQAVSVSAPRVPEVFESLEWPVPQIVVFFRDTTLVYGRAGVAELGRLGFMKEIFETMVYERDPRLTPVYTRDELDRAYDNSAFAKGATLLGVFYAVHGKDDVSPVVLGRVGWEEMVRNLVSIRVVYDEEKEKEREREKREAARWAAKVG